MKQSAGKTKLLIFGVSGDLAQRKLLPALDAILAVEEFNDVSIVGISRRDITLPPNSSERVRSRTSLFKMDVADPNDYVRLRKYTGDNLNDNIIVYLAVPPLAVGQIVRMMGQAGLNTPNVKVLFEKPFGVDLVSSIEMNQLISQHFTEQQTYRIDHYLAKEMAQNIVMFRRSNALLARVWNKESIESIEVIATEKIGIEGRAEFYEQTGALRDVMQGHMMQLLALATMEIPTEFSWGMLPQLRLNALQSLEPADPTKATRGQYTGYQQEVANLGSTTETFVAARLESSDDNWRGVPITLVTGKAMAEKTTEIRVYFRKTHDAQTNCLKFNIQPNEGVSIMLHVKKPGYTRDLEEHTLAFAYPEDTRLPDAYEQVLVDSIRSEQSLFTSGEETIQSWRVLQPLLDAWAMTDTIPLYKVGVKVSNDWLEER
ncbi:glucose-6-phosphate dehydrogenase (NADP(+)) [Candidatus Saccharibacteria bacterium]|nr:glucose-6-phosphate dehydrogenase (NADP(+)) [Candidatus Saccharibacteria bacterium]